MKVITAIVICFGCVTCLRANVTIPDPIDRLVKKLDATNGMWVNGFDPVLDLSSDAKPEEVLATTMRTKMFKLNSGIKWYRIREIRKVKITSNSEEPFTALLLNTDVGLRIFFFRFEGNHNWCVRLFDVPAETNTNDRGLQH